MNIGHRIKERRTELGLSADKLAEILGKNRSTIYRYENGDIENMPIDVIKPIASALRTTPSYLMGWDQEEIDAASEQVSDANSFDDSKEAAINSFMEEISEMPLSHEDLEFLRLYPKRYKRIFELNLSEEEFEEVYKYAQFVISKRN